jgi:hypothetical protein
MPKDDPITTNQCADVTPAGRTAMSIQSESRRVGVLYLLLAFSAPFHLMYIPARFFVAGDAASTARNILADTSTYRFGLVVALADQILFLLIAVGLYHLFERVSRRQAGLLVAFVGGAVVLGLLGVLLLMAPLVLLSEADFLAAFSTAQLEALSLAFLRLRGQALGLASAFWGLWLFPFGILVIRSRWFPRILGVLLIVGGVAYMTLSFVSLMFPELRAPANRVLLPFYAVGEPLMILWLVIRGARDSTVSETSP